MILRVQDKTKHPISWKQFYCNEPWQENLSDVPWKLQGYSWLWQGRIYLAKKTTVASSFPLSKHMEKDVALVFKWTGLLQYKKAKCTCYWSNVCVCFWLTFQVRTNFKRSNWNSLMQVRNALWRIIILSSGICMNWVFIRSTWSKI